MPHHGWWGFLFQLGFCSEGWVLKPEHHQATSVRHLSKALNLLSLRGVYHGSDPSLLTIWDMWRSKFHCAVKYRSQIKTPSSYLSSRHGVRHDYRRALGFIDDILICCASQDVHMMSNMFIKISDTFWRIICMHVKNMNSSKPHLSPNPVWFLDYIRYI